MKTSIVIDGVETAIKDIKYPLFSIRDDKSGRIHQKFVNPELMIYATRVEAFGQEKEYTLYTLIPNMNYLYLYGSKYTYTYDPSEFDKFCQFFVNCVAKELGVSNVTSAE